MIEYDPTKISIEIVKLKSVTTALGGSISVLDEDNSTDSQEKYKRYECPLSVARAFIQKYNKVTRYLIPVTTAIVKYDNKIICLERHPLGTLGEFETELSDGTIHKWTPSCELNLDRYVNPLIFKPNRIWYFDGRYVYSFATLNLKDTIQNATNMTEDGHFRKIEVLSIDTQELANEDKIQPTDRTCLAFVSSNNEFSISPPIWKDLTSIGTSKIDDDNENTTVSTMFYSFDKLDELMSVNLNFALAAGKLIGKTFGYQFAEPLQLPRLMLDLHTVNLPNVPKQIRATYDIGMKFTHALAWMLGLLNKSNDLETYITIRSLLKYLTTKGIYRNNSFLAENIFQENTSIADIQVTPLEKLLQDNDHSNLTLYKIIDKVKSTKLIDKPFSSSISAIGGLVSD